MERGEHIPTGTGACERFEELLAGTEADAVFSLRNTNDQAKQEFLADETLSAPRNEYANLDEDAARQALARLEAAGAALEGDAGGAGTGLTPLEAQLYRTVIDERIAEHGFILACAAHHRATATGDADTLRAAAERHARLDARLHGAPNLHALAGILCAKHACAARDEDDTYDPAPWEEIVHLLALPRELVMGTGAGSATSAGSTPVPTAPSPQLLARMAERTKAHFADYIARVPADANSLSVEQVCAIANDILAHELPAAERGWRAEVVPGAPTASVSHLTRTLRLPGARSRGPYSPADARSILVHEIGTHIARGLSFDGFVPHAFSTGLPGYLRFEEGVAKLLDQAVNGAYEPAGTLHYLTCSLARAGADFRRTFELARAIEAQCGGASESVVFDSVQRAFRGTGALPCCKDLVYYEGQAAAWAHVAQRIDDEDLFSQLTGSGKTDLANPDHTRWLVAAREGRLGSWKN